MQHAPETARTMSNQWQPPGGGGGYPPPPGGYGPPPGGAGGGGYGPPPGGYGGAPPGGGYGGAPQGYPQPGNPYAPPGAMPQVPYGAAYGQQGAPISTAAATILGVLTVLLACLPGGIAALMFASSARKLASQGRYDEARSKLRTSYIISGVSLCLGVPLTILVLAAQN
jgi:hypothetical protein